jgi:hypothetical protein
VEAEKDENPAEVKTLSFRGGGGEEEKKLKVFFKIPSVTLENCYKIPSEKVEASVVVMFLPQLEKEYFFNLW